MQSPSPVIFGRELPHVSRIGESLNEAALSKLDFVVVPLFHPRLRRDVVGTSSRRPGPMTRSDRELESKDWQSNVVGYCSEWCEFDPVSSGGASTTSSSSSNGSSSAGVFEATRRAAEECLRQECSWASHLGLQAVVLPAPSLRAPNYARNVRHLCESSPAAPFQQLWLKIPLAMELDCRNTRHGLGAVTDGWEVWDSFRHLAGHHHRLSVALVLTAALPPADSILQIMQRWAAEPVKAVFVPTRIFIENKDGFPVLPKRYQVVLLALLRFRLHIVFTGASRYPDRYLPYAAYLRHLKAKHEPPLDPGELFTVAYRDTLQTPLQPLMDNLESQTYEVFERDPVKYARYQAAIQKALLDKRSGQSDDLAESGVVVITVVGAGRGPLVEAALNAAAAVSTAVRIYAVEKNENAVITLRNRVLSEGWSNVTVVPGDMRRWQPPELADVLVSELLGSWGDNELSPECLDGAQACLKRGGVSIPCDYTSLVAPLSTSRLWMCARDMLQGKGLDTPYVVKLHACCQLAEAQPLFRFEHPNWGPRHAADNSRHACLSFTMSHNATLHGLTGTFESTLYADETLSISPRSHSPGLFSWFPLFLPLTTPLAVKSGDVVTAAIWRCVSAESQRVWYEWCLTSPVCTPVQNSGGQSFHVGL